jgi:hypothetical protein
MKFAPATLLALILACAPAYGQQPADPDRRGEAILSQPAYQGRTANAPVPTQLHVKNEGGSDGAGLCVYASVVINGAYQGVADLAGLKESALWRRAKSRPGGSYPQKLAADIDATYGPDAPKYAQYYGPDSNVLDQWSGQGYPIGATMNTGRQYGYKPIAHMVSLIHYREGENACVVDNNFPGVYSWMPSAEFVRRWKTAGDGWAFIWLQKPGGDSAAGEGPGLLLLILPALSLAIVIFARKARLDRAE